MQCCIYFVLYTCFFQRQQKHRIYLRCWGLDVDLTVSVPEFTYLLFICCDYDTMGSTFHRPYDARLLDNFTSLSSIWRLMIAEAKLQNEVGKHQPLYIAKWTLLRLKTGPYSIESTSFMSIFLLNAFFLWLPYFVEIRIYYAKSVDLDQTPRSAKLIWVYTVCWDPFYWTLDIFG